ncbi:hypothetical protein MADA3029_320030 [Vibrio nigripulchritudo MADA3029]|nr:hypothetical protein MADA3029_320030 [Vibrio nigripulchritudo MADA3029]
MPVIDLLVRLYKGLNIKYATNIQK